MSGLPSTKSTVGMMSIGAVALMIITVILIPGMEKNADAIIQHEKLKAHPVALNEFEHINEDLDTIIDSLEILKTQQTTTNQLLANLQD